ncbi:MAG: response regulator [Nitrososphaeria archaeon]|nr:response regulator [Nitrososphaeria archaeon]NDB50947.1 response regulator [Nitrosopumilaceae archaeon]NDB88020.1 response regulator [Nitrososphaerota archaeon]NDB63212.1 response regulator [Nitrosopumilaceae archaeon]NDB90607.1 response regulator [Nitrososphaerota archaeon]
MTAVVIDDDRATAKVFAEYLELLGIRIVSIGYDGKVAVELYQKCKPDIIFLDLVMPQYDGIYALTEIRKLDQNAKVIVTTADLQTVNSTMLASLKTNDILVKPFDIDKIKDTIEKTLRSQPEVDMAKKALVVFTITQSLLKISQSAADEVGSRLYAKYGCYFSDCLEHPEYLNNVLTEIFGNSAAIIVNKIRQNLAEVEDQQPISNFIKSLSK